MNVTVQPNRDVNLQGHYAGAATRAGAYFVDALVLSVVFSMMTTVLFWGLGVLVGHTVDASDHRGAVSAAFVVWSFLYFAVSWAASGKTFGMAAAGIRVVRGDGTALSPRRAVIRTVVFPISFLLFGLGFVGIVFGPRHRALHDVIADSAVVYSWDARTARLRFLARSATS